jgi:hypothetical protein
MRQKNRISSGDLKFKIPSREDKRIALEYHPLTPMQYLDFIETGIKLLPDLEAARDRNFLDAPTVRFSLMSCHASNVG